MKIKKILASILLALMATLLVAMPVLAAYYALVQVVTTTTAYDMLPVITDMDNDFLVTNNYIDADGRDVQLQAAGIDQPRMLVDDKTLFSSVLPASSTNNFYYVTDETPTDFSNITGYDGFVTITDDATLELGSDFEIEQLGWVDTSAGADKNLVYKDTAFRTYIDGASSITSAIAFGERFPIVEAVNGGNDVVNQINHTINLPANIEAGDLLLAFFVSDNSVVLTFPGDWVDLFQEVVAGEVALGAFYRIADGGEGASITATTGNAQMTAHTTYRITGYQGVPEEGVATTGTSVNPNPPNLTPSWPQSNTLWFAVSGNDGNGAFVAYPANYGDGRNDVANDGEGCRVANARRELNAASEDPGTFTTANEQWVANTIAIAPADVVVTATGISSGEYTVKTYGVANEPAWATGDVLNFTGAADSNINAGAIHDASAKLWVSLWFKLDDDFSAGAPVNQRLFGKVLHWANDIIMLELVAASGVLKVEKRDGGVATFTIVTVENSWNAGQWYHVIISTSSIVGVRFIIDNGVPVTNADVSAICNGGDFVIGDHDDPGGGNGFMGEIQNVIVGTDDLSVAEEAALYAGTAPGDETNYWYIDEGTGLTTFDYGTGGNDGAIDNAPTWETSTFTTGSTGRLCDFYIEVDDGVADPDRWGKNLKGASVLPNANDWILNENNVVPYMDYYKHTVAEVEHAWYQPNYIVVNTDYDGTETAGGSAVTVTDNTMTDAPGYWVGALVTITGAGAAAPEGESRVCTVFAAGGVITVAPAFSANVDIGDTFTIEFGTLIDRSYYGLEFDGVNDEVDCGVDASLDFTTEDFTIDMWLYIPTGAALDRTVLIKGTHNADGYMVYLSGHPRIYVYTSQAAAFQVTQSSTFAGGDYDTWINWVITREGADILIYKDNVDDTLAPAVHINPITAAGTLYIASRGGVNWLEAMYDSIKIYNRLLGNAERTYNYNGGAGRYTPFSTVGLVGEWHIEEGSGAATADTSGEGNNGTIAGGAAWINGNIPRPAGGSGTNDSRITWGVNPTDISYTVGSMVSTDVTLPATTEVAQDIIPTAYPATLWGMSAPVNAYSDIVNSVATAVNVPAVIVWVTLALFLTLVVMISFYVKFHSASVAGLIGTFLVVVFMVMGILPKWAILLVVLLVLLPGLVRSQR